MISDLHVHTSNSDGIDSLTDIVNKVKNLTSQKAILSIVDHHYISLKKITNLNDLILIPGVEVSCEVGEMGFHLLGYAKSINLTEKLKKIFTTVNNGYNIRAKLIYSNLISDGYALPEYSQLRKHDVPQVVYLNDLAEGLKKATGLKTVSEVKKWAKEDGNLLFTKESKYLPTAEEAIIAMKESGLVTVLAHAGRRIPVNTRSQKKQFLQYVKLLHGFGIDGIEVFHPSHSDEHIKILLDYAETNSLLVMGGTDYHGLGRGKDLFSVTLQERYLENFLKIIGF